MKKLTLLILFLTVTVSYGQDRITGKTFATRSEVIAQNGMAATSHPLATQAALDILKKGGSAVDAAIATAFSMAVTWPSAGNIGGGGFLVFMNSEGNVTTIDFREKAGNDFFRSRSLPRT